MLRKSIAVAAILTAGSAWGFAYDFVEAHVEIGWLIGFCILSIVIGAPLLAMVWDWAFDRDPAR